MQRRRRPECPAARRPAAPASAPLDVERQLVLFGDAAVTRERPALPPAAPRMPPLLPLPAVSPPGGGEARREIDLQGQRVGYRLRRARRRSIGFTIGADGLRVSAPRQAGLSEIEAALRAKAAWVLQKLGQAEARARRLAAARVEWRDGTSIPFLGEPVLVVLDPHTTGAVLDGAGAAAAPAGPPRLMLRLGLPPHAAPAQIRDAVQGWLQRQARRVFEERCRHFAERLGVRMTRLTLSAATTRWGSASADGSIRLHWRLIHLSPATIDYVVAHELAHLREMNHSAAFWAVVGSVVPDWRQARDALKRDLLPPLD